MRSREIFSDKPVNKTVKKQMVKPEIVSMMRPQKMLTKSGFCLPSDLGEPGLTLLLASTTNCPKRGNAHGFNAAKAAYVRVTIDNQNFLELVCVGVKHDE